MWMLLYPFVSETFKLGTRDVSTWTPRRRSQESWANCCLTFLSERYWRWQEQAAPMAIDIRVWQWHGTSWEWFEGALLAHSSEVFEGFTFERMETACDCWRDNIDAETAPFSFTTASFPTWGVLCDSVLQHSRGRMPTKRSRYILYSKCGCLPSTSTHTKLYMTNTCLIYRPCCGTASAHVQAKNRITSLRKASVPALLLSSGYLSI